MKYSVALITLFAGYAVAQSSSAPAASAATTSRATTAPSSVAAATSHATVPPSSAHAPAPSATGKKNGAAALPAFNLATAGILAAVALGGAVAL
ncbi:hypothetical protein FRC10_000715 [Ceratobasidium sp. 414]|nr:hypothetical protein FRC10_000715 [Ceratobasidium sp. 414]